MINGLENLKTKYSPRVTFIKDKSVSALRKNHFEDNTFDLIYIDGGHLSLDVIMDFSYTWPLLKVGGIMVFDDYKLKVKPSVDFIIACLNQLQRSFNKKCRVVFQENEQCGIRKMRD
jgi:predicted O-methyltransferase YrrM